MDLKELEAIASREMAKYALKGWTFAFSNARRRLGVCKYRSKRIEISEFYARNNPPESVLDTLLHEIAHALAGPAAGHGPKWKTIAARIGATPQACETSPDLTTMPGDWQATCPTCHRTFHMYRRPKRLDGYRCKCVGRSQLTFAYAGDPARRPPEPLPQAPQSRWEALCDVCKILHIRQRRPKAGTWRCKCSQQSILTWRYNPQPS